MTSSLTVAVAMAFGSVGAAIAQAGSIDPFDPVGSDIRGYVIAGAIPSAAVAVAVDGRIVWEEGFGWADVEKKVAATPDTLYSVASVSKPITAAGLMVLVERGKVELDAPINDYLGAQKLIAHVGDARDATVRRVANHTSGLPLHYQFFYADEKTRRPPMEESIRRYGHLMTRPGESFEYSNFGYGLLGEVIARVSGKTYEDFMRDEVFLPLGLKHSVAGRPIAFGEGQVAKRYAPNGEAIPFYDFDHPGASAVFMSAHDLARFGMFFLQGHPADQREIISRAAVAEMLRPAREPQVDGSEGRDYGIGWSKSELDGVATVGHDGGMAGVSSLLAIVPERNIVIAVLINQDWVGGTALRFARSILSTLQPSEEQRRVFAPESGLAGEWAGDAETYQGKLPVVLQVGEADVKVRIGDGARQRVLLAHVDKEGFFRAERIVGDIGTSDAARYPYTISLKLKRRGDTLDGSITAVTDVLSGRDGNAQSYWVRLVKAQDKRR